MHPATTESTWVAAKKISRGVFVRSTYRARWRGVVLSVTADVATVLILRDRRGNDVRKPLLYTLHPGWLEPCDPFEINERHYTRLVEALEQHEDP